MPINICANGHITGYRHCPQCEADTVRQVPPFTAREHRPVIEQPKRLSVIQRVLTPFRDWRKAHRAKVARREA